MMYSSGGPASSKNLHRRALLAGVGVGTAYGVLLRGSIELQTVLAKHFHPSAPQNRGAYERYVHYQSNAGSASLVMTIAFLVLGPVIIGYLTAKRMEKEQRVSIAAWLFASWFSILLMMGIVALFAWEGAICVVMATPIALIFGSLGGLLGGADARYWRSSKTATLCVAVLPFFLAPAEALLPSPTQIRTVHNVILIHADANTVWHNIERVPAISPAELRPNWTHQLGFPRPVEATLSFEGVGGIRHATFERGVLFIETVTAWEPQRRLAFTIRADSANIPPTTLDEHVSIGGRYFDVLDGEYRLEPLPGGNIRLHLTSHQRLSTDFNGYAGLWTSAVMSNLQSSILEVIQHRCEHPSNAAFISP